MRRICGTLFYRFVAFHLTDLRCSVAVICGVWRRDLRYFTEVICGKMSKYFVKIKSGGEHEKQRKT